MGLEIELKAGLSEADAGRVEGLLDAERGQGGPPEELRARYYDSRDGRLACERIALRVRSEGNALVQTVKSGRRMVGGFHQASEMEAVVSGWEPDLPAIPHELREAIESALKGAKLEVRFETLVFRRRWVVRHEHGVVEVALDRGEIRAGANAEPVLELEFELLEGSPEAVFELAAELLGNAPALLALPSKAARGQALAEGKAWAPEVAGGKPVAAAQGEDGEESWGRALATLATAIGTNLYLMLNSEDPEGPHQLRVALRRLRAALRLHRPLLHKELARALSDQARDIGRIVAPLRDCDVLTESLESPQALAAALVEHRRALRAEVIGELRDARATAFAVRLLGLAAIGGWKRPGRAKSPSVEKLFDRAFSRIWSDAKALGDRLSTLEDAERHELRKKLKKIRYLVEFITKTDGLKEFSSRLKKLQEELGFLNDISVLAGWNPPIPESLGAEFKDAKALQERAMLQRSDLALGRACRHWRELRKQVQHLAPHPAP